MVASRFQKARRGLGSDVRSECYDHVVGGEWSFRGLDLSAFRVNGLDDRLVEADALFLDRPERLLTVLGLLPPEHEIELGEAEVEEVVPVYDGDLEALIERCSQPRRGLETTESGSKNQNAAPHDHPSLESSLLSS